MQLSEYIILIIVGLAILAGIYFASLWNPLVGTIVLGVGTYIWMNITQTGCHNSDPAGNGMAQGFAAIFNIIKAIVMAVVFLLFMKFSNPDVVLNVTMIMLLIIFVTRFVRYIND